MSNAVFIFKAGLEIYHLQCARDEYGDRTVINKIAEKYIENQNLSEFEAMRRAVDLVQNVDGLITKNFDFKRIRNDLFQESLAVSGRTAPLTGVFALD